MELVSIIIPVYNVEAYLSQCIESVINQTYKNLEIILVDDGSTDNSGMICDEYALKDDRIKVIHKENAGQSSARNIGINQSNGSFIYCLDSDDYITENAIEMLFNKAKSEDADIVFFEAFSFCDSGELSKQTYQRNRQYKTSSGIEMFDSLSINKEFRVSVPLFFIKKSLLADNNLEFKNGVIYEDMLYAFQLFVYAGRVSHCHESLYFRRYRSNSTMTSKKTVKNFESSICVFKEILDFSKKENITDHSSVIAYISRNGLNVYNIFEELSAQDKSDCSALLKDFAFFVKENKQYVSTELIARTKGKIHWALNKIQSKILN